MLQLVPMLVLESSFCSKHLGKIFFLAKASSPTFNYLIERSCPGLHSAHAQYHVLPRGLNAVDVKMDIFVLKVSVSLSLSFRLLSTV